MPYKTKRELPDSVQHVLPAHAQDIYKEAFNSAWDQYKDKDDRRFAGVADIDVGEATRLRKLFEYRNRIVIQRNGLRGSYHRHFAFNPVCNRHVMAGAGAGQNIPLRLLVILARNLEINDGIEKKGDDQTTCRRGNNTGTNGSEHK